MKKMAKRFVDTELWDKKWFMQLTAKQKCLVKYVRDKCDVAGIWDCNYQLASVYIGEIVTEQELLEIDNGKQFQKIADEKIYCTGFIEFQYGQTLNEQSPIHKKVMDLLDKYGIEYNIKKQASKLSKVPTLDEVYAEMLSKTDEYNAKIQSQRFFDYYDSNGWRVGKNPMKNWKSAAAGWINRTGIEKRPVSSDDIKKSISKIANRKLSEL